MTYLEKILEEHRSKANEDSRSFKSLYEEAVVEKPTKGFINALNGQRKGEIAVIAEVKRKSPWFKLALQEDILLCALTTP